MLNQQQSLSARSLQLFHFDDQPLETYEVDGQVWFGAAEVCAALGLVNYRDATTRLDGDEKGVASTDTLGGPQEKLIVNESGLYSLILTSRKPAAKRFKRWVTHEVLPAIRRTGSYTTQPTLPLPPAEPPAQVVSLKEILGENFYLSRSHNPDSDFVTIQKIPFGCVLVDLHDPVRLATFMREIVPAAQVPEMMRAGLERIMQWPQLRASH